MTTGESSHPYRFATMRGSGRWRSWYRFSTTIPIRRGAAPLRAQVSFAAARSASLIPSGDCESGGLGGMRRGWAGAPMPCLCTTLGQDGLNARLLVVPNRREQRDARRAHSEAGTTVSPFKPQPHGLETVVWAHLRGGF
jgi:hypothetical protein